jgi:hypothetical protein
MPSYVSVLLSRVIYKPCYEVIIGVVAEVEANALLSRQAKPLRIIA